MTGQADLGTHTVCAKMDRKFLEYTKSRGNDLTSVVKPGSKNGVYVKIDGMKHSMII